MPYFAESNFDDIPEEFRLKSISNSGLQPISPEASAAQTGVENSGLQDAFSEDNPAIPRTKLQHRWSKPETETPSNYNPYGDRGLTGRQLQRIRASFEDDPLLCIEDDNARAQIEAVVARFGKDEGDQIKKAVALAHYYSMGHREKTGFIFDNLDAAIEEFEGKPMSVEQAYESIRNIYNPKQEGFYGNPGVAAVTAGGAEIWKSMINTEGFVGKRVMQGAQIAGITGVGLYSAVLRLIGAEGKAERVWESGKDMLLGRDYGQEFEDMTQRDAKTFQTIETWAQQNMNVPSDWVTNSESVADWTANATLSFINYVPQLAAQTGLMTATGGVSALATVFGINGYYDIKGDLPDISEGEALLYGIGVAGVNSLLEKVSFGIIEGKLAEKVASTGIKKGLIRALAYLGASQGLEGAEEGLEEFAENILDIGFGRRGNTKEWTAKDWAGNLLQGVPEAVFLGFTSGLPMAAPHLGDLRARAEYNERIKQFVGKRKAELDAKGELTPEEETEASVLSAAMDSNRPEQVERAAQTVVMNAKLRRKQEQDTAKKRYDEAEARLNKAQAELDAISDRTGQNAANRNTAVMKQRAAQTELDEARAELEAARRDYVKAFPEEETDAERAKREAEEIRTKRDLKRRIGWNPQDTIDKVNELAQQYTAIPIHAVQTFDDLPEAARLEAEARGLDKSKANAVWSNGEVYVIADKTRPSDTEKRILHEVVGHEGLRRVFGKDFDAFLDDVFALHSKEIEEMGLSALYNTKPDTEEGRRYLADEFLAKLAENDVKPSWWKELLAQIRAYLRKVAPKLHFSDAEIEAALVRSARAMRREQKLSDVAPESRFALGGEMGASRLNNQNYNTAIEMEEAGKDAKTIWLATGWERGKDGKWRFELPDMKVKLNILNTEELNEKQGWYLWDFAEGRELFEAYPELKDVIVRIENLSPLTKGHYDPEFNEIVLNRFGLIDDSISVLKWREDDVAASKAENTTDANEQLSAIRNGLARIINDTLVHEVQHAIQEIEGFAKGTNVNAAGYLNHKTDDPVYAIKEKQEQLINQDIQEMMSFAEEKLHVSRVFLNDFFQDAWVIIADYAGKQNQGNFKKDFDEFLDRYAPEADAEARDEAYDAAYRLLRKQDYFQRLQASMSADQTYKRFAGEVEGRNIQKRAEMSEEERRNRPPSYTEDVHRAYQIVRFSVAETGEDVRFSIRQEPPPKKTLKGYKVFAVFKNKPGLYPPMVANPGGEATPVAVWLNADAAPRAEDSKTGRPRVQAGGKGTNTGKQTLAFRPGWHLGEVPVANQFMRTNPETGEKDLFPDNFVWAECEIAADVDYQEEAMSYGKKENGKFQHSLAGLPRVPKDGFYRYRTNPDPNTDPWLITGAMKVTRLLDDADVEAILKENGREPYKRQGGPIDLSAFGLKKGDTRFSVSDGVEQTETPEFKNWFKDSKVVDEDGKPLVVYHGTNWDIMLEKPGEAVFSDKYISSSSGDYGFFGRGFYFTFGNGEASEHEAGFYGKNVYPFYLSIQKPFYFLESLRSWNGSRVFDDDAGNSVELLNAAKLFPELLSDIKLYTYDKEGDSVGEISIPEYADMFNKVYREKKFEFRKDAEQNELVIEADPVEHSENGETWTEYGFSVRMAIPKGETDLRLIATHYYLEQGNDVTVDVSDNVLHDFYGEKEFRAWLEKEGYDGVMQSKDGDEVVAFRPEQIKSATENVGTFDPNNPDVRFSVAGADNNLIAVHNVTEQKLRDAIKLGALPVPSIGIIDAEKSNFTDYGAITLIGDRDLIDPKNKKNKVFDSDVYSPTRPNIQRLYTDEEYDRALEVMDKYDQPSEIHDPLKRIVENHKYNYDDSDFESDLKNSVAAKNWYSQTKQDDEDFESWWQRVAAPELNLHPTGRIFDGFTNSGRRRYLPANLETIVKLMTRKVRDAEGFFYGFGNVRSNVSKQFKSIAEIQKSRDKIVSNEDYKTIKKEVQEEYYALLDDIEHAIVGGRVARSREAAEDLLRAMAEGTRKQQNREWLEMALGRENPIYQDMADFLTKLKNMPTRIFEAKPQRAVYLDEFRAAVVPEGTSRDILNALEQAGVDVFTYANEEARRATLQMVTKEKNLRFSLDNMSEEDKSDLVKLLKPKWNEEAFVEPSEVKAYLESIGETVVDENEAWSLYQMAGAAIRADNKRAKERARDKWIEQNYDLIAKVSEFTSNRGLLDFVIRPSFRFKDNDEWPGTFIAEAWRKKGKKPKQFARESDLHYRERLRKRDEALEHADGKASDELAQEIADKYGGDPLDIEEKLIETFRYLKKTDLYRAYSKFMSEQNYRTRQENEIAEAEYAEYKREQIEQTVADMLENGKQITEEWAMANPEVFKELYRLLMNEEPPKSRKPSKENLEAINARLANEDVNAATYKAARKAAWADFQKKLTALRQEMNDKNANAVKLQREAAAFAEENLPPELRGMFTRGIIKLLDYGTSPSKNFPEGRRMHEFYQLQDEILKASQTKRTEDSIGHIREMLDAVKMRRNWKGIPVSVIPSEQTRVERIRKIIDMSAASVANAIEYNNSRILELEAGVDAEYDEKIKKGEDFVFPDIEHLKQKYIEDNALLELFGNLEYRKPDSVLKAEDFLQDLIKGGKAKFKSLLAQQAGRVMVMRQQAVSEITGGKNVTTTGGAVESKDAKNHTPYILKNMHLGSLLRLVAAKAGIDFDSTVAGKLWISTEKSTQKEMTANRHLQEDFDAELNDILGTSGQGKIAQIRKKGRFLKGLSKVEQKTGVFKTQFSRQKVIDPLDAPIVQVGRSSSKIHLIPVEDYTRRVQNEDGTFEEIKCPGVRSILRAIDNGGAYEIGDGVNLDETGVWMLRKQLEDYDAGIDRRLDFFVDEIDKESAKQLEADSEKDKLAVIFRGKNVESKQVEVPLSQGTALQILLTWEQEDYRANMKWNGWTEESIEQIKKFLKPETLRLGYWMRDYFAKQRGELDEAVVKRYGAHLPENQNYWPGRFSGSRTSIGTGGMRGAGTMSINPSFLIARKFHLNPLDMDVDAFSVFFDGQITQNHFLAWTDTIRDMREVFGDTSVQDAINENFGKEVTKNLVERIVTIAQGGRENNGFLSSFFSHLNRYWVPAKIALNPSSFIKQRFATLSYMNFMPVDEYVKYMSRANMSNMDYKAFVQMALNSDYLKNRWAGGLDKDLIYMMQNTRDTAPYSPLAESLLSVATYMTKHSDRWSALHGGFAVYQYNLDQARKSGLSEKEAQERARRAWMRATDSSQQSGYLKDLNYYQQNQGLVRFYTAFLTSPIQVMNLQLQTLNDIKYNSDNAAAKKKLAKQIFVNHVVVMTLMQFTTDMVRAGLNPGDWWDDAEFEDYFTAWLFGPFEGLFFVGKEAKSAINLIADKIFGRKNKMAQQTSAVQLATETTQNFNRVWNDLKDEEITAKDIADGMSFAGDLGMLYGATPAPGAAAVGSTGAVVNAGGTLAKRILKAVEDDEDGKKKTPKRRSGGGKRR